MYISKRRRRERPRSSPGSQVLARPSGTEPKIKFYGEVREALSDDDTLADGEVRAGDRVASLVAEIASISGLG